MARGGLLASALFLAACGLGCGAQSAESVDSRASLHGIASPGGGPRKAAPGGDKPSSSERSVGFVATALHAPSASEAMISCPAGMVAIEGQYCIDRYEASLLETLPSGEEQAFSPFATVGRHRVRAVSEPNVYPQGYISATQAGAACAASGKRLCKVAEWQQACRGPEKLRYGYAEGREPGRCNDKGKNPVVTLFGFRYDASTMNQPRLNQLEGTLARTGEHADCSNGYGVHDMVGNLHEWVADPKGTFYGGYYQDVASVGHGDGCGYRTTAHEARYHDYSTGFRCCADVAGSPASLNVSPAVDPPKPKSPKRVKPFGRR